MRISDWSSDVCSSDLIGATQEFEFEAGILKLHADYAYIASRYFDYFTTGDPAQEEAVAIANEASRVKSYGLVNAQVSFTLRDPEIEFTVWGKNLANTPDRKSTRLNSSH